MTTEDELIECLARGMAADRARVKWDEMPAEIHAMYRDEAAAVLARLQRYGVELTLRQTGP